MGKYIIIGNKKYLKGDETLRNEKRAGQYLKKAFNLDFTTDHPSVKALVRLLDNRYSRGYGDGSFRNKVSDDSKLTRVQ